jgi:hypothetical protein
MIYSIIVLVILVILLAIGWWREAEYTNELTKDNDMLRNDARNAIEEKRILLTQINGIVATENKINHE